MIGCHNFVELLKYSRKVQNGNRFTELNNSLSRIEGLILESEAEMEITHKLQYFVFRNKVSIFEQPTHQCYFTFKQAPFSYNIFTQVQVNYINVIIISR